MKKIYKAKGLVHGKYWGGGEGSFEAENYEAKTKNKLDKMINKGVEEGTIDSGMGYEKVLGALMVIETIETINKEGKEYKRSEFDDQFYGDLDKKQQNFLLNNIIYR